ncbi:MAG TPA: hypothetical protein VFQ50_10980 [Flavobacterium sp.]|jgi:hypothetical protein|nr:hypothetical protein [Flavobacterium sp.]
MKKSFALLLLLLTASLSAQVDTQLRYESDTRQFYVWNEERGSYELRETEYEHSVIDIREIGSKNSGYIVISLSDNGESRIFHGSITGFQAAATEGSWSMRSKLLKGKLTYNPEKNTFTYTYEATDKRYNKILIFTVRPESS